jgi:hypothetical protein
LFLSLVYLCLFATYGLESAYSTPVEVPYDKKCGTTATCQVAFTVPKTLYGPIGLYYRLTNFKQMRRELATSFQSNMLRGKVVSESDLKSCEPRIYYNDTAAHDNLYIPCGLLPQTVFNDQFTLIGDETMFSEADTDITLDVDRRTLFMPADPSYDNSAHWLKDSGLFPNGQTDPHFIVWMRQSTFSPFRKLYAIRKDDLPSGTYVMSIRNYYNASLFNGHKYFILATLGAFGTITWGPAVVFGVMSFLFLFASAALGVLGWRRMKPSSQFHPNHLREIFAAE